ncbi:MAG TPA: DUF3667 domain-containing protein [Xanthomonadaceae bacterium]|jgi:hypothetical protein|nr:DUF3667 domain-containing protein [Xanthomonadaceae bacterium]
MTIDSTTPTTDPVDGASVAESLPTGAVCSNCGTPLLGEHCFHCGQPVSGLVRHFSSVMGDIADTVFEIDTRLTRTMVPLLLRPGFLSCEYFAGRRVRYVSPVRLFFFISVIAFFVAQWTFDQSNVQSVQVNHDSINGATTVAEVEHQRDVAIKAIETTMSTMTAIKAIPGATKDLTRDEDKIRRKADARIAELNAALAQGKPPPEHVEPFALGDDDKPWDPVKNPVHVDSFPAFANRWLNQMIQRAQGNFSRVQKDQKLLMDAWLSAVPSTLFLLLPMFAVLLKLAYIFKRRLYMEHFIVALHSHAFLCLALLLALVLGGIAGVTPSPWLRRPLEFMVAALIAWMPVYLFLMQKRVYGQGWIMTFIKYSVLGFSYLIMLSFGAALSLIVKFLWL